MRRAGSSNEEIMNARMILNLKYCAKTGTLLLALLPNVAMADPLRVLTPLELFSRCYTHITQLRLSPSHPLRAKVIAKTITPVDACMTILKEANIVTSGTTEGQIATATTVGGVNESLAVLQNFNSLHVNFAGNSDIVGSVPDGAYRPSSRTVIDETEFALHFTRALFAPGESASQIVTGSSPMEALRSNGNFLTGPLTPGVQLGTFLGVRKMQSDKLTAIAKFSDGTTTTTNGHLGGGILGTASYLSLNFGSDYRRPNGGLAMPRRWAKAVYKDLLCRAVPVVRPADGVANIQANPTAATPPFRTAGACVACHTSMDPMAATARNLYFMMDGRTSTDAGYTGGTFLVKVTPSLTAETGVVDSDSSYYKRPPNGTLRFRSYDGTYVNQPVTSIADLGAQIALTNDFYACTASKYFKYFTGITVNLQDIGDTSLPTLSASDLYYRNLVISLGQGLKSSQNLQTLIHDILSSTPYSTESFRSPGN
jgi:hypothetical protein